MAGSIWDWSQTAASNDDADGDINWAEGQPARTVNNSARVMMQRVAQLTADISGKTATTGSSGTYALTTASPFTAYADGVVVGFTANHSNTSTATLNANTLGAKPIYSNGAALVGGEIVSGAAYLLSYDTALNSGGGGWHLLTGSGNKQGWAYPADYGAVGSADDTAYVLAALQSPGTTFFPAREYIITEISITGMADKVIYANGATFKRKASSAYPANAQRALIYLEDPSNVHWFGGTIDGNAANVTDAAQNFAISGMSACLFSGLKAINPKAVGGAYGAGFLFVSSADEAQETHSLIEKLVAYGDGSGTYGVSVFTSRNYTLQNITAFGWVNGGVAVKDPTLPVPASPSATQINVSHIFVGYSGIGVEIFGFRSGVSSDGYSIAADQHTTAQIHLSHVTALVCDTYGVAVQADSVSATHIDCKDCGTIGSLYGGVLWNSRGTLAHSTITSPIGIGIDIGGAIETTVSEVIITPSADTTIGINAGASISCTIARSVIKAGAATAVLASGFDGSDSANWIPWLGRDLMVKDCHITVNNVGHTGVRASNGFNGITLSGNTLHMRAAGRAFNMAGAERVFRLGGNRVIDETDANAQNWTDAVTVASASTIAIPDTAQDVTISGTTTINTILYQDESDMVGKVRVVASNGGVSGTGYTSGTTISFSGGAPSVTATATAVRSDGKIYGAYVVNPGTGYGSAPTVTVNDTAGVGATLSAYIGAGNRQQTRLTLAFAAACAVGNGTGNVYLSAAFTASALGTSRLPLFGDFSNFCEIGR
jgi:hypothetical protein